MKTIFENNGGSYTQQGNYLLPNLTLSDGIEKQIGVWGIRHKRYLKSNHRVLYYNLLSSSFVAGIFTSESFSKYSGLKISSSSPASRTLST